jgi:hypothetical protein
LLKATIVKMGQEIITVTTITAPTFGSRKVPKKMAEQSVESFLSMSNINAVGVEVVKIFQSIFPVDIREQS